MAGHDFSNLYARYPDIIKNMPEVFTTHQFILRLAQQNQTLYVEALYSYRHHEHRGAPTPFLVVHGILAQNLNNYQRLIRQIRKNTPSKDIFGQDNTCSEWQKIRR